MWSIQVLVFYFCIMCNDVVYATKSGGALCRCEKYAYDKKPFVAVWNSPTIGCDFNFSTPVHLKKYGIYENDRQTWNGKRVTVFSAAQLGLYPYYVDDGERNYNGGLPQLVDLGQHLRKTRQDINSNIPDPDYDGLAVIDWEPWRPVWETNWNTKRIYKIRSVELVRSRHPNWNLSRLIEKAKQEFEDAGRSLFEHTITVGKEMRPKALWGFYGFPDCFAHEDNRYQCTPEVQKQNDHLEWLFSASTALFPSMYLLDEHPDNRDYVLGRLRETLRFASKGFGKMRKSIPIFAYHRNIYENNPEAFNLLTEADLRNTIGAAADIGASGIVIWGNRFDENTSPQICHKIDNYVSSTLGPFFQNKVREIESCSTNKCNHRGHCVQRSLLTPGLLKRYQDEQRTDACTEPTSLLHGGNILHKKTQVFNAPLHTNNATTDIASNFLPSKSSATGYNIDLGVQQREGTLVNHSTMDEFFKQLNGSTYMNESKHDHQNTSSHHEKLNKQLHGGNTNNISHASLHNVTKHDHAKVVNIKKSEIPHAPMHQLHNASGVANHKKSMIVHQLLGKIQGSLISTPELLLKRHNITKPKSNSSRKSQIASPASDLPYMASKKSRRSWLPHMYVILIGVSLGGALMFSLIFVAVYYYIGLRNTFPSYRGDNPNDEKVAHPKAHSSPKGSDPIPKGAKGSDIFAKRPKSSDSKSAKGSDFIKKEKTSEEREKRKERGRDRRTADNCVENVEKSNKERDNKTEKYSKRFRSVERNNEFDEERNKEKYRENQVTNEEKARHSHSRERVTRSHERGENRERKDERRSISRERRESTPDVNRSRSRRDKLRPEKHSEEEGSEIEININELR